MNNEILFYFDELCIRSILRDLIKHSWMMIIAAIAAIFLVSGYQNLVYQPEYTSRATLVISAKGSGNTDAYASLTTTTEMAQVFSNVFSSNVLKKRIVEEMDLEGSNFDITAQTIPETNLMVLRVTGPQPKLVYQAICGALEHYVEVSDYVFSNAVLDVMESPEVPTHPSNTIPLRSYQKKAAAVAIMLMGAFLVFMSVMRHTIKTEAAAKRRLKGTKLAVVGHEQKNRTLKSRLKGKTKSILITNPITTFGYVETFRKLAFRIQSEMRKKGQQVLLVSSVGENEGKSTVATNIALALAQNGKRVILVDLDLRRPAIYKIFDIDAKDKNGFWEHNIDLIGQPQLKLLLHKKNIKNPAAYMKQVNLEEMILNMKENADFIIIDSSPMNVAADAELVLSYADTAILVVRQDWAYTKDINHFIDILKKEEDDFLGYVLNNFTNKRVGRKQYNYGYGYEKYRR